MTARHRPDHYDVVVAGARVAGASTAMLLARAGLRVLVVDPARPGSDTLSTHALMRGAVLQLSRWGLLDRIRDAGTPRIDCTTFHYGTETVRVPIEGGDEVDGLYAPRRTVLDPILVDAAREAGADVRFGWRVDDVTCTPNGHVTGVTLRDSAGDRLTVRTDVLIGADGRGSRVARALGARTLHTGAHATATVYGYVEGLGLDGYHWHFGEDLAAGVIPTNGGAACVYAGMTPTRFHAERARGLDVILVDTVRRVSPDLFLRVASGRPVGPTRGFAGAPGHVRESAGPGWALVGDAGYFKDPLTAHGITDALRDAELLARAIVRGRSGAETLDDALRSYARERDALSRGLMTVTDRIASFSWSLGELAGLHKALSREMKAEVDVIREWNVLRPAA